VAARTRRVRVGHGVTLLPFRYNHPIRIAERVATLDILSNGRVSWGSGKSSSLVEQVAFENEIPKLHEQWLEAVEMIPRMWAADVFEHKGKFFQIAPTQIVPKPVQKPHPPMFAACSNPDSAAYVGRLGLGALNFAFGSDDFLTQKVAEYRRAVAQAKPVGRQKNDHFACTPATLVLPDDKKACTYGMRGARFFASSMAQYYLSGKRPLGKLAVDRRRAAYARAAAVTALGSIGGPAAVATVELLTGDDAWLVRAAAAEALSRLGEPGRAALLRAARSPSADVREQAEAVLQP